MSYHIEKTVSVTKLSETKRELLEQRLSGRKHGLISPKIAKCAERNHYPLSAAQKRLWLHQQLAPNSVAYNIQLVLRLEGDLNLGALEEAFSELLLRHQILRATIDIVEGEPVSIIQPPHPVSFQPVYLGGSKDPEREPRLKQIIIEEAERGFDLRQGPLLRLRLFQIAATMHVLLITLHHIVVDGWSLSVLSRELVAVYEAICQKKPHELPPLSIQYTDFACWEQERKPSEPAANRLRYWKAQLVNVPVLDFPTDRRRPVMASYSGKSVPLDFSQDLPLSLAEMSRREGVTTFCALLAVFYVLLYRYTGQTDIVIGTSVANRTRPELEDLIGVFANLVALRISFSSDSRFSDLLVRTHEMLLSAYEHQDLAFDQLVEELKPARDSSRNPIFQICIVFENTDRRASVKCDGLTITPIEIESTSSQFDMTVYLSEANGQLNGSIVYSAELFDDATIRRFSSHFGKLLESVVNNPSAKVSDLPLLTEFEQGQLLVDWQGKDEKYPVGLRLHHLFEAQSDLSPRSLAVTCGNERLTYEELNRKANRLAHFLQSKGVGAETLVGVCMNRSVDLVVALLGVLKAGGAYLPIDPNYPPERVSYLLADSEANIVITHTQFKSKLPASQSEYIGLDKISETIDDYPTSNPDVVVDSLNLAYLIYTSGSTGKPKGVQITHGNAVHSTLARFGYYQESVKGFLLLSSFAFDSSVAGIFWTLGQGGCLVIPEESTYRDPLKLIGEIQDKEISHLLCLPSFYRLILDQGAERLRPLRAVIVAGESCPDSLVKCHHKALPDIPLYNEYGPTEGTVWSSACRLSGDHLETLVSIGRPINNVAIYLLDAALNPVPVGVTGEIYIGGAGVARGYLNRPDQTAERFIPNGFSSDAGEHLYRTGDLGRWWADGNIEFLGRTDHQVKIRGFRIELGEIEAKLKEHPGLREALVLSRDDITGGQSLIAYCIPVREMEGTDLAATLTAEHLRHFLQEFLPDYMVPSNFVFLDDFPVTPNGKLDRERLKECEGQTPRPPIAEVAAPSNETEEKLVRIWSAVLGVETLRTHDNFFELGGHSLLAVQLILKVNETFNRNLDLAVIFERPTVASLADLIDSDHSSTGIANPNRVDLAAEAVLDPAIQPDRSAFDASIEPKNIFLTGATGFLGAFLLHELLSQTSASVHCLVRAEHDWQASDRLRATLERYRIFDAAAWERVVPVCGDLGNIRLGLSNDAFDYLAGKIEAIYHNGAVVNFVQPYSVLKGPNVLGTQEVLRLACHGRTKPVHYVSTLSVFGDETPSDPEGFRESEFPGPDVSMRNGYSESKWVSERLVREAHYRGLPVTIHRPATIVGHSITGVWNVDDYLCRLIRACIGMGEAPIVDMSFDVVPVDYVSRAIVFLANRSESIGNTLHFSNTKSISSDQVIDWLNALGYLVKITQYQDWRNRAMAAITEEGEAHPLYPLISSFPTDIRTVDPNPNTGMRYSSAITQRALKDTDICCPVPDKVLWNIYLTNLQHSGLITRRR